MRSLPLVLLAALLVSALSVNGQKMDQEAMMKWGSAKVVYYTVEGVHSGDMQLTRGMGGYGEVADRVSMNLEWNLAEMKLVGTPVIENATAAVGKLRDAEPKCLPPVLKGPLEMTLLGAASGLGGAMDMKMEVSLPTVEVAQFCTASRKSVPASKKVGVITIMVPSPVLMAMGAPATNELAYSADGKSMILKARKSGGWTWTFTPSTTKPK